MLVMFLGFGSVFGGYSLSFDGMDDHVPYIDGVEPNGSISLCAWFKSGATNNARVISKTSSENIFFLMVQSDGALRFNVMDGQCITPSTFLDDVWHFAVGVWDGSNVKIYVDGQLEVEAVGTVNPDYTNVNTSKPFIGSQDPTWENFDGLLDEISVWDIALTETQIQSYYTTPITGSETGLVGHWNFNEGTGSTVNDATGNGYHGSIVGATWSTETPFLTLNDGLVAFYPFNDNAADETGNGFDGDNIFHPPSITSDRFGNENSAYSFDGIDDEIVVSENSNLWNSHLTVSAWANFADYNDEQHICEAWTSGQSGVNIFYAPGDDKFVFQITIDGTAHEVRYDASNYNANEWYFFSHTYDGTSQIAYINGIEVGRNDIVGLFVAPTSDFIIGNDVLHHQDRHFNGLIDDLRIHNRALSVIEIESLYHQGGWDTHETGTVTDIDGNVYQTVKIGDQWWMAENLKVTHYQNGDAIPNLTDNGEWIGTTSGAYCYYDNDIDNSDIYGANYNWYAVEDSRNLAPEGWRIPTDDDWKELELYLGIPQIEIDLDYFRGSDEGGKLKSIGTDYWADPNTGASNESGFTALPGGTQNEGGFFNQGTWAYFWSSTAYDENNSWNRTLSYSSQQIARIIYQKELGFSVRCLLDVEEPNLVAYYPFEGNTQDASGNGYDITSFAATPTADRYGHENSAYEFDGIDDYMLVAPAPDLLDEGSNFTITGWISPNQYTNENNTNHVWYGCEMSNYGHGVYYQYNDGDIAVNSAANGSHTSVMELNNSITPLNDWVHFAARWDNDGEYAFFINGEYIDGIATTQWNYYSSFVPNFYIGADQGVSEGTHHHSFSGKIDEFRIYDAALSNAEIEDLVREDEIQLTVGSEHAETGTSVLVPIEVAFPQGDMYRSAEINFSGYTEGLSFTGIETAGTMLENLEWSNEHNENETMLLTAFAGTNDLSGSGILCYLMFDVSGEICTPAPIVVEYAKFNSNESVASTDGGVAILAIPDFGDVDQNDIIEALDASDIMVHVLDRSYLDCQGMANADVYLDGAIDLMDASMILRYLVELEPELPVAPDEVFLALGDLETVDQEAIPSRAITIPFNLSNGENIYSFEGQINYDPQLLTPDSFEPVYFSPLLDGFMRSVSIDEEDGLIHLLGASANPDGEAGQFLSFNFVLNEGSEIGASTEVTLDYMKFNSNHVLEDITSHIAVVVSISEMEIPTIFTLEQNYPNPFNPRTTIRYGLPEDSNVSLVIYDVRGQVVQTIESQYQSAGWYDVVWNGEAANGKVLSTGIYFARLDAGNYNQVIKMLYLK